MRVGVYPLHIDAMVRCVHSVARSVPIFGRPLQRMLECVVGILYEIVVFIFSNIHEPDILV